jgi:protein O-mannosyl-transferase
MIGAWRRAWLEHPAALSAVVVLGLALASSLAGLGNGFALDDVPIVEENARIHSLRAPWTLLTSAYWQLPPHDTLWRPWALPAFAVQWAIGGGAPMIFHAVNIALYAAVSLAVLFLARTLLPAPGALVAASVFAVHPVHVEAVANVVGQLELWSTGAVVLACAIYARLRASGRFSAVGAVTLLALLALGLGMKESAVVLPGLFLALELTVLRDAPRLSGADARRWRLTGIGLCSLIAIWLILRHDILGGLIGEHPHVAFRGMDTGARLLVMLGLVPELARLLLWPARLASDYSPAMVPLHAAPTTAHLPGLLVLAGGAAALVVAWRRQRWVPALALLWIPVSLGLVLNIVAPTGVLIAERTLFLATVGIALLAGALATALLGRVTFAAAPARTALTMSLAGLFVVAAAQSSSRQSVWFSNETLTASLILEAPQNFRGYYWLGDALFRDGQLHDAEQAMWRAMELWPAHDGPPLALALRYHERGLCVPAIPLYERVIELEPQKVMPYFGLGACQMQEGQLRRARRTAYAGLATGQSPQTLTALILAIDSALATHDTLLPNNGWVRRRARP